MRILLLCFVPVMAVAAGPPALERLFDSKLNDTQRANACFELRGAKDAETVAAMGRAMESPALLSCAAENLRIAGAPAQLLDALRNSSEQVRAAAVRALGSFQRIEFLEAINRAAGDENLLVATNAVGALSEYRDPAVIPYLSALAVKGGMIGDMAIDRLALLDPEEALLAARRLLASTQVPDKLYAMRVIGASGNRTDLPALKKIAASGQEDLTQRSRGFGFMPPISLSRAAQTATRAIESRVPMH